MSQNTMNSAASPLAQVIIGERESRNATALAITITSDPPTIALAPSGIVARRTASPAPTITSGNSLRCGETSCPEPATVNAAGPASRVAAARITRRGGRTPPRAAPCRCRGEGSPRRPQGP
jgi:hypothetical protein